MHKIVDGKVVELTPEEIAEFNARQEEWLAGEHDRKAKEVRSQRDELIAETDWWASSDLTITQEQIEYRQALRDVPNQDGFPFDIQWPTKPE